MHFVIVFENSKRKILNVIKVIHTYIQSTKFSGWKVTVIVEQFVTDDLVVNVLLEETTLSVGEVQLYSYTMVSKSMK